MLYVYALILTLLNLALWASILFSLPGAWLMILIAAMLEWFQPGQFMFSWTVLFVAVGFAALGEVLEFILGAAGAREAGGSKRAAALAILGGFIGAIAGTALPVLIVGTLIGACLGAFLGSVAGDIWAGRTWFQSYSAGRGAAVGRFWGTIAKVVVGGVVAVLLSVAAFV